MTTDNPYLPPAIIHEKIDTGTTNGTLQDGIDGNYDFNIIQVIKEAWRKTDGVKAKILGTVLIVTLLSAIISVGIVIITYLLGLDPRDIVVRIVVLIFNNLLLLIIIYPIIAGIIMLGIHHSVELPVKFSTSFAYFGYTIPIIIAGILITILVLIGHILLIIPGVYLLFAYFFTFPLIVEKNLGPWQAMETSRKAVTHHWFKIFFTISFMLIILLISIIPLGIGLIWTLPMTFVLNGILYRIIFGVEEAFLVKSRFFLPPQTSSDTF